MIRILLLAGVLAFAAGSAQAGLTMNALFSNALSSGMATAFRGAQVVAIELPPQAK